MWNWSLLMCFICCQWEHSQNHRTALQCKCDVDDIYRRSSARLKLKWFFSHMLPVCQTNCNALYTFRERGENQIFVVPLASMRKFFLVHACSTCVTCKVHLQKKQVCHCKEYSRCSYMSMVRKKMFLPGADRKDIFLVVHLSLF